MKLDLRILRCLEPGPDTRDELERKLQADKDLVFEALQRLWIAGLVDCRRVTTSGNARHFYELTESGRALWPSALERCYQASPLLGAR